MIRKGKEGHQKRFHEEDGDRESQEWLGPKLSAEKRWVKGVPEDERRHDVPRWAKRLGRVGLVCLLHSCGISSNDHVADSGLRTPPRLTAVKRF